MKKRFRGEKKGGETSAASTIFRTTLTKAAWSSLPVELSSLARVTCNQKQSVVKELDITSNLRKGLVLCMYEVRDPLPLIGVQPGAVRLAGRQAD